MIEEIMRSLHVLGEYWSKKASGWEDRLFAWQERMDKEYPYAIRTCGTIAVILLFGGFFICLFWATLAGRR